MPQFGIGARLRLGFGTMTLLLALVVGFVVVRVQQIDSVSERMTGFRMPVANTSAAIETQLFASLAALRGYLLTNGQNFKDDRAAAWAAMEANISEMESLSAGFTNSKNRELWENGRRLLGELRLAQNEAESLSATDPAAARKVLSEEAVPRVSKLIEVFEGPKGADGNRSGGMVNNQRIMLSEDAAQVTAMVAQLRYGAWFALILGFILSALIARKTAVSIVPPLVQMTKSMNLLAGGDLSAPVPDTDKQDEVGAMAKAMRIFKSNMERQRELEAEKKAEQEAQEKRARHILEITAAFDADSSERISAVSGSAKQMNTTAAELSATAEQTSRQATAVSAAAEEASSNVQTVAAAAEELSSSIGEITRQVTTSSRISAEAMVEAERTQQVMNALSDSAARIGEVVHLINDIASQTNLLALNATIEAARAGDAGKGFAVVANEVKSLANQTAKATDEITQQIASVQQQTEQAAQAIRDIVGVINRIGEIASSIASAMEEQSAATSEIARNVEQAAAGTRDVTDNVSGVQAAAGQTGHAAASVLESARDLASQSDKLSRSVAEFLTAVKSA